MLISLYDNKGYSFLSLLSAYFVRFQVLLKVKEFDLVWIEKEALPWLPVWLEKFLLSRKPFVLDYDDAIFHQYDQHRNPLVRFFLSRRIDLLMKEAAAVVCGNKYLVNRAILSGANLVKMHPTVIDINRYHVVLKTNQTILPRIVWIGSPSTIHYLEVIRPVLQLLAKQFDYVLRIIGCSQFQMPDVSVELIDWTENSEVQSISDCQVGIMPLIDSDWERGKCGYKLIQYMACGIPVVASGVGVNKEIVRNGENGFLANSSEEWFAALSKLLEDDLLRSQMGAVGRQRVVDEFCSQQTGPRMIELLLSLGGGS